MLIKVYAYKNIRLFFPQRKRQVPSLSFFYITVLWKANKPSHFLQTPAWKLLFAYFIQHPHSGLMLQKVPAWKRSVSPFNQLQGSLLCHLRLNSLVPTIASTKYSVFTILLALTASRSEGDWSRDIKLMSLMCHCTAYCH